ncbi:MAG: hypothetical protein ACKVGZ_21520, partial [Alphaproteobacteria bacterium]
TLEHAIDLHYPGQLSSLRALLPAGGFDAAAMRRAFEVEYERLYGHVQPDGTIMTAALRVASRAATGTPKAVGAVGGGGGGAKPHETRLVWHEGQAMLETAV